MFTITSWYQRPGLFSFFLFELTVDIVDLEQEFDLVFRGLAGKLVHCVQEFLVMMMVMVVVMLMVMVIVLMIQYIAMLHAGKKSSAASIINAHCHQHQCHRHHFEGYTWNEMDPLSSLSKIWNTRSTKKGWGENINHTALPLTRMSTAIKRMLTWSLVWYFSSTELRGYLRFSTGRCFWNQWGWSLHGLLQTSWTPAIRTLIATITN